MPSNTFSYTWTLISVKGTRVLEIPYMPAAETPQERETLSSVVKAIGLIHVAVRSGEDSDQFRWRVTLRCTDGRERLTVNYTTGKGIRGLPACVDVLACLLLDAEAGAMAFEQYCVEFGLDTDSRKAWQTWRACKVQGARLLAFLGARNYQRCINAKKE